jgi:hypothetical protein
MKVILDIPDEIACQLRAGGQDLSRTALEGLAADDYRRGLLTQVEIGQLLGPPRTEIEDFLAQHVDLYDDDAGELHRESELLANLAKTGGPN